MKYKTTFFSSALRAAVLGFILIGSAGYAAYVENLPQDLIQPDWYRRIASSVATIPAMPG